MPSAGAVVVGGYINGLGLIRALAARGIPVAVITTQPYDIAHRSSCVVEWEAIHRLDDEPDALIERLRHRAKNWQGWAVVPSTDGALAAVAAHYETIASSYRLIAPPPDAVPYVLDKGLMRHAAEAVGIRTPHCYGPADAALPIEQVRYPVVVKPVMGYQFLQRFGCKLFTARNREELIDRVSRIQEAGIPCNVFDQIPGPDDRIYAYCTYIDRFGTPSGGVTIRKIRQSPPFFGVARVAEVVPDIPELRDATIALLRSFGFRGMAAAEFKFDERDASFRFMEVNGRSVIYNALLRKAGLDLAMLAWADQMERRTEQVRPTDWPGAWINLHADVLYSALRRREDPVSWGDFIAPYRRPIIEAVWSRADPLPFMAQWARTLGSALSLRRPATG